MTPSTLLLPRALPPTRAWVRTRARAVRPGSLAPCAALATCALQPFAGETLALGSVTVVALLSALHRPPVRNLPLPLPLVLLLLWAVTSVTWSGEVRSSLTGVGVLLVTAALAVDVAARHDLAELVDLFGTTSRVLLAASLAVYVLLPSRGRTVDAYEVGSLEGVFAHRNLMGYIATLAAVTFAALLVQAPGRSAARRVNGGWLAVALLCLLWTNSRTTLVAPLAVGALVLLARGLARLRPGPRRAAGGLSLAVVTGAVWWGVSHLPVIAASLGRDATLTGRTDIWPAVLQQISLRPVTGYGWGALWHPGTEPTQTIWDRAGFAFFHAHDGFLDVALQLGVVGLLLTGLVLAGALRHAWRLALRCSRPVDAWPVAVLGALLFFNGTETVLNEHLGWFLLVALAVQLPAADSPEPRTSSLVPARPGTSNGRSS